VGVDSDNALNKCREMTSDGKSSRDRCIMSTWLLVLFSSSYTKRCSTRDVALYTRILFGRKHGRPRKPIASVRMTGRFPLCVSLWPISSVCLALLALCLARPRLTAHGIPLCHDHRGSRYPAAGSVTRQSWLSHRQPKSAKVKTRTVQ
jgi:hypothetical protein